MTVPRLRPPSPGRLFAGGRAPACWQRQMARPAAAPRAIENACRWLKELAGQPTPRLRARPLLGHCLADLVTDLAAGDEPAVVERQVHPRVRKMRPAAEYEPGMQPSRTSHSLKSSLVTPERRPPSKRLRPRSHGRASAPGPEAQPARAGHSLLSHLAGPGAARQKTKQSRRRFPLPAPRSGRPIPEATVSSGRDWSGRLADRVRQRVLVATPGQMPGSPRLAWLPTPATWLPKDLLTQWQQPLQSQTVTADQLAAWAAQAARTGRNQPGDSETTGIPGGGRLGQQSPRHGQEAAAETAAGVRDEEHAAAPSWSGRRQSRPRRDAMADVDSGPGESMAGYSLATPVDQDQWAEYVASTAGPPAAGSGQAGRGDASRFAPPQMAATLPPLRPPAGPGVVTLPAAATAARKSARREEQSGADDLDELARQLKQILDEESRRHGIDV